MNGQIFIVLTLTLTMANALAIDLEEANNYQSMLEVSKSFNQFSGKLYESVSKNEAKSLVLSPLSVAMVLAMATYGARGSTLNEMSNILDFHIDNDRQKVGLKHLITSINAVKNPELRMANKIFVGRRIAVKPEYLSITNTIFKSATERLDFANSAAAGATINEWCEKQTNSRVKDIVRPDDFDEGTVAVLVNAVYFKGNWLNKFEANETQLRDFYVDSQTTKKVPMMHRLGSYKYGLIPELDARFIELPYQNDGDENSSFYSMIIILPNAIDGLANVEAGLRKLKLPQFLTGDMYEVDLFMPKFKIESAINLKSPLEEMGMREMFTDTANFKGIVDSQTLKVSKIVQKAFIEVNEEGSEAAAATVSDLQNRFGDDVLLPHVNLIIDRPFYMFITDGDTTMFNGRYVT